MRKHILAECENCPLQKMPFAPTSGPADAEIAFVSRSPGKHDIFAKKPFAGPSGKVLDYLLGIFNVNRRDIITTNVVLCRSDDPPKEAILACKPRLEEEIKNCKLVIAGGTEATAALTKYKAVFSARPFVHQRGNQRVIVTNNPALVIRDSDAFPDMMEDFRRAFDPPPPAVFPEVEIINNADQGVSIIRQWMGSLRGSTIAADLEWGNGRIVCSGFSKRSEKSVVFGRKCWDDEQFRQASKDFFESGDVRYIWHNGKADTKELLKAGINARVDEDTFLQSYALDERPGYHSLEYLLSTRFGWPDYEPQSVKHFKKTGEFDGKTEAERRGNEYQLYKYNGWDAAGTFQLFELLNPKLDSDRGGSVRPLYERLLYASERFRQVELNGFHYDVEEACNINEREAIPRLYELTEHIQEVTGRTLLNPSSPKQLQGILYTQWGLTHNLRDSGKKKLRNSTGKEVREEIFAGRFNCKGNNRERILRWAEFQQQYSKVSKLKGTYLEGLVVKTLKDGKLYCNFNPCGTVSGRTSSFEPNFQNIAREGYGDIPGIRTLFRASPGNVILSADFSQAELRTCAKLSGDSNLLAIYKDSNRSLHRERAAAFYGENYTKEEYVKSKNINFGVTYGQSAQAFAQMYHMPEDEADEYVKSWWREFPDLLEWTKEIKQRARKEGSIVSPFGHKRRFHLITDENIGDVEREAVNFLPQNIAAWLTICALCDLVDMGVRLVATVHDSLVADVPRSDVIYLARTMREVMLEQPYKQLGWTDIPFDVDVSYGENWGALEEVDLQGVAA